MRFTAIVTAHKDTPAAILDNLAKQTVCPGEVLVGISDYDDLDYGDLPFELVVKELPNDEDYGYRKRRELLKQAKGEFVGFFCHDDSYELTYIERMLASTKDVAYCWWDEWNPVESRYRTMRPTKFEGFVSSLGSFIVRRELLESIGGLQIDAVPRLARECAIWAATSGSPNTDCEETAKGWVDAETIKVLSKTAEAVAVQEVLYHHNKPFWDTVKPMSWGGFYSINGK